ncbi:TPA: hypothetical protein P2Q98_004519 [Aeromonas veronii]|uniref:hypothetical protein n=1 Tax=Aeromonas TaxID=642 RepID=UPI002890BAC6|nr:hypothetical protein [Aeromonas hydrophila]ELV7510824.1 hypothetical protein [Aeromonas veronii]HDO1331724.1 hypothetical protein [Aeromonas veronii]HDO1336248.1 hypothetical protein [Aeromonas veronii]HDO1340769.1 hypothetical protein [Aeromonas veronii]HDO1345296.1 hypothetical protein [Aeromonas veronii]
MQPNEPFFPPLVIEGVTYEFSHLDPFTMRFVSNSAHRQLRVNVRFSNHCFSYSPIDGQERPAPLMLFDHNDRERIFCPTRYRLSLSLPDIVRSLNNPKCKVYQTAARRNFNYSLQVDDPKGPYHLFFEISKSTGQAAQMQDLNMFVESAYHEEPIGKSPDLLGKIGFHVLCTNVYLRKPVATKR